MKKNKIEIIFLGRGGMGAKTAALFLGEAMVQAGKFVQAFPEYGPERRGAPVVAFIKISEKEIKGHYGIKEPDAVCILDQKLLLSEKIKNTINEVPKFIINTSFSSIKKKFNLKGEVYTVDASRISKEIIGKDLPNTPILGALIKILNLMELDDFIRLIEERLKTKYKEDIVQKNIEMIKRAYKEVK